MCRNENYILHYYYKSEIISENYSQHVNRNTIRKGITTIVEWEPKTDKIEKKIQRIHKIVSEIKNVTKSNSSFELIRH